MRKLLWAAMLLLWMTVWAAASFAQAPIVTGIYTIGSARSDSTGKYWTLEIDISSQSKSGQITGSVVVPAPPVIGGQTRYAFTGTVDATGHVMFSYGRFPRITTISAFYSVRMRPIVIQFLTGTYSVHDYSSLPPPPAETGTFSLGGP